MKQAAWVPTLTQAISSTHHEAPRALLEFSRRLRSHDQASRFPDTEPFTVTNVTFLTRLGRILRHDNRRCVCPPGTPSAAPGRPVIVASMMRSGTHLLIDSMLNNCTSIRRAPLYIDLDQLLLKHTPEEAMALITRAGPYLIKTHYPQLGGQEPGRAEFMKSLCQLGTAVTINRDQQSVERSFAIFTDVDEAVDLTGAYQSFSDFWASHADLAIDFSDLTTHWDTTMDRVWSATGLTPDGAVRKPLPRTQRYRAYANKVLTRLFGRRAPVINTTIGFALRRPS